MNKRYEELAYKLLKMQEKELKVREELANSNELYNGYHEKMMLVHNENADELEKIIFEIGWPTVEKVGYEAAYAAWLIIQHAISKPSLQRKSLPLLQQLANDNLIDKKEVAMLYDRICFFEMKPQKYGTQFDFDINNELSPWVIEDNTKVDIYRKEVGLPPLNDVVKKMQEIQKMVEIPKQNYEERIREREIWSRSVGWIK